MNAGDMSTLSFHATKVYNTIEGGALIVKDEATKKRIDYLKNFGIVDEVTVVAPGINSKMDEMRSAYFIRLIMQFLSVRRLQISIVKPSVLLKVLHSLMICLESVTTTATSQSSLIQKSTE